MIDIRTMPAGPEMNRRIAKEVFGYRVANGESESSSRISPWELWREKKGNDEVPIGPVPFSNGTILDGWLVAEEIHRKFEGERMPEDSSSLTLAYIGEGRWVASFSALMGMNAAWHAFPGRWNYTARGETAQLAICRAALLLVEGAHGNT